MGKSESAPRVFLSYASEDRVIVRSLYERLASAGYKPWMDKIDIFPGEDWMESIRDAIRQADFFLACLSPNSINKQGVLQEELKSALEIWRGMSKKDIYLIPVRLTECDVPSDINHLQWVDLFQVGGFSRLENSLREGLERREDGLRPGAPTADARPADKAPRLNVTPTLLSDLHRGIQELYNVEEIKNLCVELGVDYENLVGDGKSGKIRELIGYFQRRGQLLSLIEKCRADRPDYPW